MGYALVRLSDAIWREPPSVPKSRKEVAHEQWLEANGDKTLRMDYPLNETSVVLDVGGYEGQWASDIFSRYLCRVYIFEPIPEYAHRIRIRFRNNDKITVHQCAVGRENAMVHMHVAGDASSMKSDPGASLTVSMCALESILKLEGIASVDLMKINIEGGEYDLLEHMIESGAISIIRYLQIQFHDFVPKAEERMRALQVALARTHFPTYQYPFVWEGWERRLG